MSKYDGIKNPELTDEEFEAMEHQERIKASMRIMRRNTNPQSGDFMGYHACPWIPDSLSKDKSPAELGQKRVDMLRPETGDWICPDCGFVVAIVRNTKGQTLTEDTSI